MESPRVEFDLNDCDADGRTLVFLSDAIGKLEKGRIVVAFEPEDGVCARALVASINEERGTAYLWVDWQSLVKEPADRLSTQLGSLQESQMTSANATAHERQVSGRELVRGSLVNNVARSPIRIVTLPSSV